MKDKTKMSEAKFQAKVIKALEKKGWEVIKNLRTNKSGWPDLTAHKPHLPPLFIEVKGARTPVSALQKYRHQSLRSKGFKVMVIRDKQK